MPFVQQAQNAAASGSTLVLTPPATTTAGSCLVICWVGGGGTSGIASIAGGGTWSLAKASPGGNYFAEIWICPNASAVTDVTITFNAAGGPEMATLAEFSGLETSPLDTTNNNWDGGAGSTTPTTGSATPTTADNVAVGMVGAGAGLSAGPSGGFTGLDVASSGTIRCHSAYKIQTAATAAEAGWTLAESAGWDAAIIILKATPVSGSDKTGTDALAIAEVQTIMTTPDESIALTEVSPTVTTDITNQDLVSSDSLTLTDVAASPIPPADTGVPTVTGRVDWWDSGAFTDPLDDVSSYLLSDRLTRGRSTDHAGDAIGSRTFRLRNDTGRFTPDRNWHDNPSFEVDTTGWAVTAIASLLAAGTSIAKVVDNAPSAGSSAGEAVLPATLTAGVAYEIPHKFRAGVPYQIEVYLKSMSGATSVEAGLASSGSPADLALSSGAITTSWAAKSFAWTPSADHDNVVFFVRTNAAAAATVRIDRVQINPGSSVNAYLEAPTKGLLIPGRPVHLYATWLGVDYPLFFGRIERISPIPLSYDVEVVCYDQLRRYQETDVVVAAHDFVQRSAHDMRVAVLDELERGTRNLLTNPSFETNTTGWSVGSPDTVSRITTDAAAGAGSACGEFVALTGARQLALSVRLAPVFFAGQVYRLSVYLRTTAGSATWRIGLGTDFGTGSANAERDVTVTTAWQRFTLTYTMPATVEAASSALALWIESSGAGTVRVDGAMVTRGQALHPYSDTGSGRWPNWCGNGSFDGGALNGWYDGWTNLVGNPSFETNTTGWSVAGDAFVGAATSITRVASSPQYGTARADVAGAPNSGAFYAISGTFVAGVTYRAFVYARVSAGAGSLRVGIGSQGTPTDKAESASIATSTNYQQIAVSWTPTADRTDAHLYVKLMDGSTTMIDGAAVFRRDPTSAVDPVYADTGPGGGGSFTGNRTLSATAKYGSKSQSFDTPATAGAGRVYDFNHIGAYLPAQAFTASVWIRPSSNMPYKVGFAANKGDGTFDEPTAATGTATAGVWTQVTVTWTPSAERSANVAFDLVLYVYQTDATARTVLLDGIRVIPGSSADDFEMTHWSLAAETDVYSTAASLAGTGLGALTQLNRLTLSRHYARPTMSDPFYEYVVGSRDDLADKAIAETIVDTGVGGVEDLSPWQLDRRAIINVVPVVFAGGTEYYSDEASVDRYEPRPGSTISGGQFFTDRIVPDVVGPALVDRYKDPRARPQLRRSQKFPNLLARQVDDLISVSAARLKVATQPYLIVIWDLDIQEAGLVWRATYTLEEMP
jgi:hypothetical protein